MTAIPTSDNVTTSVKTSGKMHARLESRATASATVAAAAAVTTKPVVVAAAAEHPSISTTAFRTLSTFVSRLLFVVNLMAFGVRAADATCSGDQRNTCSQALTTDNWSSLASGGECMVKQYVYFTHVCTVNNYLPNIDYCCCVQDASLLCCRYHQDWNHFRCVESDDVVELLESRVQYPPLEILLPSILLPVLAALTCLVCCVRKCCFSQYDLQDDKMANSVTNTNSSSSSNNSNNGSSSSSKTKSRSCGFSHCYENLCGYELAMDSDDSPVVQTTYHCSRHQYNIKDSGDTPTTICSTDGQGLPYCTDPASCYTSSTQWYDHRPGPLSPVSAGPLLPGPGVADDPLYPGPLSPSAFCPDCSASRRTSHASPDYSTSDLQVGWILEPSAPPEDDPDPTGVVSSTGSSSVTFCLPRQTASQSLPVSSARRYRYIPATSGCRSGRSGSMGGGHSGRINRPYFRSLVPGGEGAFPVPPPAYDDS